MPSPIAAAVALRMLGAAEKAFGTELAEAAVEAADIGGVDLPSISDLEDRREIIVPVTSSAISAIGYNTSGVIIVRFRRGGDVTYYYPGTEMDFLAFLAASSKGAYFNEHYGSVGVKGTPFSRK